jgi:AAA ATPase domain
MATTSMAIPMLEPLFGRDADLAFIESTRQAFVRGGGALVLTGEPGIGKTALLRTATRSALSAGMRVLSAAGVEFEEDVAYAGLNQLLLPLQSELEQLTDRSRRVLSTALGFDDGTPADRLAICNATLELLELAGRDAPVLIAVDDLPWLDRTSAGVLALVARRTVGRRLGFLGVSRAESEGFFERAGLPQRALEALDDDAASALLEHHWPDLEERARAQLLADARGNPLALMELCAELRRSSRDSGDPQSDEVPLPARLQSAFARRISNLLPAARELLLLSALEPDVSVGALGTVGLDASVVAAEGAGLVRFAAATGKLEFRHPLVRAAVVSGATPAQRRGAHRTLALALSDDPDRHALHRALSTIGPDEETAKLLTESAHRRLARGDATGAVADLVRAADFSPMPADRNQRLAKAAWIGADVAGDLTDVPKMLAEAAAADPGFSRSLEAAGASAYFLLNNDGEIDAAHRLLVAAIQNAEVLTEADESALVETLYTLLYICYYGGLEERWPPFYRACARLRSEHPLFRIITSTYGEAMYASPEALHALDEALANIHTETDPARIIRLSIASAYVDRLGSCRTAMRQIVEEGYRTGAMASAMYALLLLGFDHYLTGEWEATEELLTQAVELCEAHGYRHIALTGRFFIGAIAGARGDTATADAVADEIDGWATPRRIHCFQIVAASIRSMSAISAGNYEEAYLYAESANPPGEFARHSAHVGWVMLDFIEAAVHTGRFREAEQHAAAIEAHNFARLSSRMALLSYGSMATAIRSEKAFPLFERAIGTPGVERWAFDLARVRLIYGERLRRDRLGKAAQRQLREALPTFRRLGATPWVERTTHRPAKLWGRRDLPRRKSGSLGWPPAV